MPERLKADILQCSSSELSEGLCLFIREVQHAEEDSCSPDNLFYLCLSIQLVTSAAQSPDSFNTSFFSYFLRSRESFLEYLKLRFCLEKLQIRVRVLTELRKIKTKTNTVEAFAQSQFKVELRKVRKKRYLCRGSFQISLQPFKRKTDKMGKILCVQYAMDPGGQNVGCFKLLANHSQIISYWCIFYRFCLFLIKTTKLNMCNKTIFKM